MSAEEDAIAAVLQQWLADHGYPAPAAAREWAVELNGTILGTYADESLAVREWARFANARRLLVRSVGPYAEATAEMDAARDWRPRKRSGCCREALDGRGRCMSCGPGF